MSILHLVILFVLSLTISLLFAPLMLKLANFSKLSAVVHERSAHTRPTPSGGGLIFILATGLLLGLNAILGFFVLNPLLNSILLLAFVNSIIGLFDDKLTLSSWARLLIQLMLVIYPVLHMPLITLEIPAVIQYFFYTMSWVWFINLFNFMDGTDGYAAQESIFILLFLFFMVPQLQSIAVIVLGSCLGFLKVNYPKASIFMGNVGSYFLGYLLFGLMLYSFSSRPFLVIPCFIISLLFTLDATTTLIRRMIRAEPLFQAHRTHWYQRLYNMGYSHRFIFWLGVMINSILLGLASLSVFINHSYIDAVLALVSMVFLALIVCRQEKSYSSEKVS